MLVKNIFEGTLKMYCNKVIPFIVSISERVMVCPFIVSYGMKLRPDVVLEKDNKVFIVEVTGHRLDRRKSVQISKYGKLRNKKGISGEFNSRFEIVPVFIVSREYIDMYLNFIRNQSTEVNLLKLENNEISSSVTFDEVSFIDGVKLEKEMYFDIDDMSVMKMERYILEFMYYFGEGIFSVDDVVNWLLRNYKPYFSKSFISTLRKVIKKTIDYVIDYKISGVRRYGNKFLII